jgi:hypothetical protein
MNEHPRKFVFLLVLGVILALVSLSGVALAATPIATSITLTVGETARFGETVPLSARLVDSSGTPIAGAKVTFVVPGTFFLGTTSDVLIAVVTTDKQGVAASQYQARDTGWLSIQADFSGDDRYAGTKTTSQILVDDQPQQLYVPHVGVQVPGLNISPLADGGTGAAAGTPAASDGLAGLWPAMSAWPIALVLLIVWSMYALAVRQMFRIVRGGVDRIGVTRDHGSHRLIAGGADDESNRNRTAGLPMPEEW